MASQLLNQHSNPSTYKRQKFPSPPGEGPAQWETDHVFAPTSTGLILTAATAFALAWSIRWLHARAIEKSSRSTVVLLVLAVAIVMVVSYYCFRHQWLQYLRTQAVESGASVTINAHEFDAAASAGILLIQEVELVSRGYNLYVSCKCLGKKSLTRR